MPKGEPKEPVMIPCKRCGVMMQKHSGCQKYCKDCAKAVNAARERKRWAEKRDEKNAKKRELYKAAKEMAYLSSTRPKYSVAQVTKRADALGISYGKCSQLLNEGKITMED